MKKKIFIIERTNIYVNNMIYFDAIFSFRRSNGKKPTPSLPPPPLIRTNERRRFNSSKSIWNNRTRCTHL